jgi:hypothetical protein
MLTGLVCVVGFAGLVGCDSSPRVVPLDAVAQRLSIDVEVTPQGLALFANGTDQVCACDDERAHFAEPGECVDLDDVIECHCDPVSCLTAELTGTGVGPPQGADVAFPIGFFQVPAPLPPDLVLRVGGCGHPDVAIPIEPFTAPTPTVTADVADKLVTVHWQTDAPAASAYVSFGFHVYGHACHTTAAEASFMNYVPVMPGSGSVGVTTYLPVQIVESSNREIRIWRGNGAYTQL